MDKGRQADATETCEGKWRDVAQERRGISNGALERTVVEKKENGWRIALGESEMNPFPAKVGGSTEYTRADCRRPRSSGAVMVCRFLSPRPSEGEQVTDTHFANV